MGEANAAIRIRAGVVVVNNNRVLLVRQNNHPFWVLPGGTLELGETLPTCAVRELEEELKLTITLQKLLGMGEFIPPTDPIKGQRHVVDTVWLATADTDVLTVTTDENLNDARWFGLNELDAIDLKPDWIYQLILDGAPEFSGGAGYFS
ncbi:MAG: NUDIX hydrolase [Vampirovibrionales bacterium]|nr:NUDIX hydrolase [Vampirovibrionales bacterium]